MERKVHYYRMIQERKKGTLNRNIFPVVQNAEGSFNIVSYSVKVLKITLDKKHVID